MEKSKIKKKKISECCKAPMIGGVQCENCGSDGKFTETTAIVRKLEKVIDLLQPNKKDDVEAIKETKERFIDNGDGTISDTMVMPNGKRLMWQKDGSQEKLNYAQAEEFVAELNKEQYPDWRLPTVEELFLLVDRTRRNPAINPLFKCESDYYWTSTVYAGFTGGAWVVYFDYGYVYGNNRGSYGYVRPCRQY